MAILHTHYATAHTMRCSLLGWSEMFSLLLSAMRCHFTDVCVYFFGLPLFVMRQQGQKDIMMGARMRYKTLLLLFYLFICANGGRAVWMGKLWHAPLSLRFWMARQLIRNIEFPAHKEYHQLRSSNETIPFITRRLANKNNMEWAQTLFLIHVQKR